MIYGKWRDPYDEEENLEYDILTSKDTSDGGPSMTLQAPAEEQDINVIMKRFGVKDGSKLPRWEDAQQMYGDFSQIPTDPVEAAEYLRQGQLQFAMLPAEIRRKFDSPEHMFNWLTQTSNHTEAIELGLLERRQEPPIPLVRVIPEPDAT